MKRRTFLRVAGVTLGVTPLLGIPISRAMPVEDDYFQNGDTVCFIGDSITHGGLWKTFVGNYFFTRFPQKRFKFMNCGISGDTASGVLRRFSSDILPNHPDVAVIMLGMNDVQRHLYGKNRNDDLTMQKIEETYNAYRSNMQEIAARLKENGCTRIILATPSPYDQTANIECGNSFGVNDELHRYSQFVTHLAQEKGVKVVDFHGAMTRLTEKLQQADLSFSFTPNDRVHPNETGHQVIAYLFLKGMGFGPVVSEVTAHFGNDNFAQVRNAKLSNLCQGVNQLSFYLEEFSLPYPVSDEAKNVLGMLPLEEGLNQQILKTEGLPEGVWQLFVDGGLVGSYNSRELREGLNLAFNNQLPQYKQAQNILVLNMELRGAEALYRNMVKINTMLENKGFCLNDRKGIQHFFETFPYGEGSYSTEYYIKLFSNYFQLRGNMEGIKNKVQNLYEQIYSVNKPQKHHYKLVKA